MFFYTIYITCWLKFIPLQNGVCAKFVQVLQQCFISFTLFNTGMLLLYTDKEHDFNFYTIRVYLSVRVSYMILFITLISQMLPVDKSSTLCQYKHSCCLSQVYSIIEKENMQLVIYVLVLFKTNNQSQSHGFR